MKMISLKKIMSLVLVLALVIGGINLGARKVSAEGEEDIQYLITDVKANLVENTSEGNENEPAIQYVFDRETVKDIPAGAVNVVILFDASSSMSRNIIPGTNTTRLDAAKTAAVNFANSLIVDPNVNPTFYLYSFNGTASGSVVSNENIESAIKGITTTTGTNLKAAVEEALANNLEKDSTVIVIVSDGEDSVARDAEGKLYASFSGYSQGSERATTNADKVHELSDAALADAKNKVKNIYAIRIGSEANSAITRNVDGNKIYATDSAATLKSAFVQIADEIVKNATQAYLYAEIGDHVDFVSATLPEGANGNVTYGTYSFAEGEDAKPAIIWKIDDPNTNVSSTDDDVPSPVINFQINKTPAQLFALSRGENPDPQIRVTALSEDGTQYKIELDVTVRTVLVYDQKENEVVKTLTVPVSASVNLVAYEVTSVEYTVQYVYYENNETVEIASYSDVTVDNTEIEIPELTDEQFAEKELNPDKFIYSENNDFTPVVGVDNHNFTIVLQKLSTVRFIDEVQALEGEELPVTVQEGTEVVGTELTFPEDRPDFIDENGVKQIFQGWGFKVPIGGAYIGEDGQVHGPDRDYGISVVDPAEFTTYGNDDLTFYAAYEPEEVPVVNDVKVVVMYRYAADGTVAAPDVVKTGKPGESYSVTSPVIGGFTASTAVVAGKFEKDDEVVVYYTKNELPPPISKDPTPIPPVKEDPTPTPTADPTPIPTPEPTPEPTEAPTPTPEPEVEVEEPETPEGDVEIEEIETPEGAPEEVEVEPIDTPQGDLPKTGVAPAPVFFGIGAACVLFGSVLVIKRRKEEN